MVRTWWGAKFLDVLETIMDHGRLTRGRAYSGPNRLLQFSIKGDVVKATMRGNVNPYFGVYTEPRYKVTVEFRKFSVRDWQRINDEIANNAACLSQLLMNEMPLAIEDVCSELDLQLLPDRSADIISECSCPDWASPCKHVAGVYYKIASLLDRDPFLIFQLRGMEFAQLQEMLAVSPLGQALSDQFREGEQEIEFQNCRFSDPRQKPLATDDPKSFWLGKWPFPDVAADNSNTAVSAILVKRGGDFPAFWDKSPSFIETMEPIYKRVVEKNKTSL